MSDQPDLIQGDDSAALATLEQVANGIIDPTIQGDVIIQGLNFIYANGGDHLGPVLDDIQISTDTLIGTIGQLGSHLKAAATLAATWREQREAARQQLDDLKTAIAEQDSTNPEIADLIMCIEESINEESMCYYWEMAWEYVIERIGDSSPLSFSQVNRLMDILTGDELPHNSPRWNELNEWIDDTNRALYGNE